MNATENEFRDHVHKELDDLKKQIDQRPNKTWAKFIEDDLNNIFSRLHEVEIKLTKLENRVAVIDARTLEPEQIDAMIRGYFEEIEEKTTHTNATNEQQTIDDYLNLYDQILTKVSDKYKTMDIRLKKDIATTIFIRLMQK